MKGKISPLFLKNRALGRGAHLPIGCTMKADILKIRKGRHPAGYKESVEDTARVLGRMSDGIEFRDFYMKMWKSHEIQRCSGMERTY